MEPELERNNLEGVGHAHVIGWVSVIAIANDLERPWAAEQLLVLEAAHSDLVLAGGGVLGDVDVVVAHCETSKKMEQGQREREKANVNKIGQLRRNWSNTTYNPPNTTIVGRPSVI